MRATHLYAAYGSNLHPARLCARVPSATLLGASTIADRALRFHKRGQDGSGKCDIIVVPGEQVHVAVYRLDAAGVARLHDIEGVGRGYRLTTVEVPGFDTGFTYVAEPGCVDPALACFSWYRALVMLGCEHFRFPRAYREQVAAVPVVEDPDRARHLRHMDIVTRARGAVTSLGGLTPHATRR